MNNPKTRDDDERSSVANQSPPTEKEARRVVEGGDADKKSQRKETNQKSHAEGPAAYAPHSEGEKAFPGRDPAKKKTGEF